jgi:hypothetical protein
MALRTTIDLDAPDRQEITDDVVTTPRGTFVGEVWTETGRIQKTATRTVKTWVANTRAACEAARTAYAGTGSVRITEASPVIKSYLLEISEEEITVEFFPEEE